MTLLATLDHADADLTACLARVMAAVMKPGDVIALQGPVGAGKTHFARAFIRARQGDAVEDVPSPTFTLVQTYDDPLGTEIWHADLYRLSHPDELVEEKAGGGAGYNKDGDAGKRERLWMSPSCLNPHEMLDLWGGGAA